MKAEQELFEHFRLVVDKGQSPLRIDKFLASKMESTSRNRIQLAAEANYLLVNEQPVKSNYKVRPLDHIRLMLPFEKREFKLIPQPIPLNVVFEDKDLMVLNKPAGLVVHPGHGNYTHTLLNGLAWHLGLREELETEDIRMGVLVHRLDKDTTGLLAAAKSEEAQFRLAKQFFDKEVDRLYTALVWGDVHRDEGTVSTTLARHPADRLRYYVPPSETEGRHAVTHYRVLERLGYVTLMECRLETGRTHQIRVHMEHLGHPIFGDTTYGGDRIRKGTSFSKYKQFVDNCFQILPRQALHAGALGFLHPVTHKPLQFHAPLPEDFQAVLDKWRTYAVSAGSIGNL